MPLIVSHPPGEMETIYLHRSGPLLGADFWAEDATKRFSVKKKGFSVKRGEGFSERGAW